jgi:tetratricopeptide (TPR) repeat protein
MNPACLLFLAAFSYYQADRPQKPIGTFDDQNAGPPKTMRSVGVRGTIDAGGYAASAADKTRTALYQELSQTQVDALRESWELVGPCNPSQEPRQQASHLLQNGDFAGASAALEQQIKTDKSPEVRELLGLAYEGAGQLEAAAEQFRSAVQLRPNSNTAFAQGAALLLLGETGRAEEIFRIWSKKDASRDDVHHVNLSNLGLAAAAFQRGDSRGSIGWLLNEAARNPESPVPFAFAAVVVRSLEPQVLSATIQKLSSMLQRVPGSATAHYALACALSASALYASDQNQIEAIEQHLKQALALDPHLADAHFRLGTAYAARQDWRNAVSEFQAALREDPTLVEAHYRLGQIYMRSGDAQNAKEQLQMHQQQRAAQKAEVEGGKVLLRFKTSNDCR